MANAVRLFSALKPNPLSALVPLKNPVFSMDTGVYLVSEKCKNYSFYCSGGKWGGNKEIESLKPCDLRVRKYVFFRYLSGCLPWRDLHRACLLFLTDL